MHHPGLMDIALRDPRYAYEAYEFLFEALNYTQMRLGKYVQDLHPDDAREEHHVSGGELVAGACELARREFGRMARVVFHLWGIDRTDDFGELVFNLIEANLLSKTDSDTRTDFNDLFDLDTELRQRYVIELPELEAA